MCARPSATPSRIGSKREVVVVASLSIELSAVGACTGAYSSAIGSVSRGPVELCTLMLAVMPIGLITYVFESVMNVCEGVSCEVARLSKVVLISLHWGVRVHIG